MAVLGAAIFGCAGLAARTTGLRINTTDSMPIGLYRIEPLTGRVVRGAVVTLCLPIGPVLRQALRRRYVEPGSCPGNAMPLLKPVAAVAGDIVTVTRDGISVDGVPIPNSAALSHDAAGCPLHPIPPGRYQVEPGEMWLVSSFSANSWDSRYLGPVPVTDIRGTARPVWVFR